MMIVDDRQIGVVVPARCTGCGDCVEFCPVDAIELPGLAADQVLHDGFGARVSTEASKRAETGVAGEETGSYGENARCDASQQGPGEGLRPTPGVAFRGGTGESHDPLDSGAQLDDHDAFPWDFEGCRTWHPGPGTIRNRHHVPLRGGAPRRRRRRRGGVKHR
jgi:ferredoxin